MNSPTNSDPKSSFFSLLAKHWAEGTGIDRKISGGSCSWNYRLFANAADKVGGAPDSDTVAAWCKGQRWPKKSRKDVILAVFFPADCHDPVARKTMADAWEEGQRAGGTATAANRQPSEDPDPPRWDRLESWGTPRLAEHGMADPAPQGNSDTGLYRIVGRPIVSVVEAEYEGRYVRVGVNNVQVLLDSAAYDIQPNSRVSERENNPQIRTVAGGVQVHASDESESLDGPLWGYGDVLLVQRNGEPDGSMEVSLRAGRRSFRVGEFDEQGREKQVETTTEKTAIIDVILRKDREIDGLGHIVLAKVRWKRSTE